MTSGNVFIYSAGHLHGGLPATLRPNILLDLSSLLDDPAHVPDGDMLDMTGSDPVVRRFVLDTEGARDLLADTARMTRTVLRVRRQVVVVYLCQGGKHRSAAMAEALRDKLASARCITTVVHLHKHKPRVLSEGKSTPAGARP